MPKPLTEEQYDELLWLSNDRPLGSMIETGRLQHAIEKTKLNDPTLNRLISQYKRASRAIEKYMKVVYGIKFDGVQGK